MPTTTKLNELPQYLTQRNPPAVTSARSRFFKELWLEANNALHAVSQMAEGDQTDVARRCEEYREEVLRRIEGFRSWDYL